VPGRDLQAVLAEVEVKYIVLKVGFKVWTERANTMMLWWHTQILRLLHHSNRDMDSRQHRGVRHLVLMVEKGRC
jgi:hypothetical protein